MTAVKRTETLLVHVSSVYTSSPSLRCCAATRRWVSGWRTSSTATIDTSLWRWTNVRMHLVETSNRSFYIETMKKNSCVRFEPTYDGWMYEATRLVPCFSRTKSVRSWPEKLSHITHSSTISKMNWGRLAYGAGISTVHTRSAVGVVSSTFLSEGKRLARSVHGVDGAISASHFVTCLARTTMLKRTDKSSLVRQIQRYVDRVVVDSWNENNISIYVCRSLKVAKNTVTCFSYTYESVSYTGYNVNSR